MKLSAALLFILSQALAAHAQAPAAGAARAEPGLVVLKFGWDKERVGWERDPFAGPVENFDDMRVRARNERRVEDAKRGGNAAEVDRVRREARADAAILAARRQAKPPRYVFRYKASVRNEGASPVTEVDWDYVFFDAGGGEEVGRHRFTSVQQIDPGKSKELSFLVNAPPAQTVSVYSLGKNERASLRGQVELVRVQFEDGTVWRRR